MGRQQPILTFFCDWLIITTKLKNKFSKERVADQFCLSKSITYLCN